MHFPKNCKLCKLSWIQDSRFWGKLLESRPGLGFKKFSQNLESWIKKNAILQTFLDSRFKILGETSWIQAWFWIQEVFLRILSLESPRNCKFANFPGFKIHDSGWNFLNPGLVLDSRSFSQNLESWIHQKNANLQTFVDSRFKILGETSWIQALFWIQEVFLRILNPKKIANLQTFFSESWILNLESQKKYKLCKLRWVHDSRFKILGETSWIQALTK